MNIQTPFLKTMIERIENKTFIHADSFIGDKITLMEGIEYNIPYQRFMILIEMEDFICPGPNICNAFPFYRSSGINSDRAYAFMPYISIQPKEIDKNVNFPFFLKNPIVSKTDTILDIWENDTEKIELSRGIKPMKMIDMITELKSKPTISGNAVKSIESQFPNKTITLAPYRFQYSFEFMFVSFFLGGKYWNSTNSTIDRQLLNMILGTMGEKVTLDDLEKYQLNFNPSEYETQLVSDWIDTSKVNSIINIRNSINGSLYGYMGIYDIPQSAFLFQQEQIPKEKVLDLSKAIKKKKTK